MNFATHKSSLYEANFIIYVNVIALTAITIEINK